MLVHRTGLFDLLVKLMIVVSATAPARANAASVTTAYDGYVATGIAQCYSGIYFFVRTEAPAEYLLKNPDAIPLLLGPLSDPARQQLLRNIAQYVPSDGITAAQQAQSQCQYFRSNLYTIFYNQTLPPGARQ